MKSNKKGDSPPKKWGQSPFLSSSCPLPIAGDPRVTLAHGGGGRLTHQLIEKLFLPAFKNEFLESRHDGAVFNVGDARIAFTTDSYVVRPLFFPGGDIGSLAVYGTVNDLAMCGARPLYLSVGLILEEGLEMSLLQKVTASMKKAAEAASIQIVTGDTKVVDKGKGDGIYINTAGVGLVEHSLDISPKSVRPGDQIFLNGDLGRHGIAIMAVREGLQFESTIESDSAPLWEPVRKLLEAGIEIHCLRDLTRGGLASALNEIAGAAGVSVRVDERKIPVGEEVRGASEMLGLDPLYVANEGRFIAFVPRAQADRAGEILGQASLIGEVRTGQTGLVTLTSKIGTNRILDMISGEQLPRIC